MIRVAKEQGRLYYLQHTKICNNTNKEDLSSKTWVASQIWLYHKRLGHPLFRLLNTMFPHLFTKEFVESFNCDDCQFLKQHRKTLSPNSNKSPVLFDFIHSNVWGLTNNFISGAKWFVSFIDDCTYVTWIFLMKHTYEFLKDNGVVHKLIYMSTPQQNKVIERKTRHLLEGEAVLTATYLINKLPICVLTILV
ncbi:hypothetical protein CR513_32168, partial [Mucuna pruriens]